MTTHAEDSVKLEADGIIDLYRIDLTSGGGTLFLKANDTVTWQGHTWEGIAIQLSGYANSSDEEMSRPQLTVANPEGVLSQYVLNGHMEKALVKRIRVLRQNLLANLNIFDQQSWYVIRVSSVNRVMIAFELRNPIDGPNFLCPARMFLPPEFPAVSLN
jgi:lambda family phage minor tail protein L